MQDRRSQNCERTWREALEHSRKELGEEDYSLVLTYQNPAELIRAVQELEDKYARSTIPRILKSIKPQLARLQTFAGVIILGIGSNNISAACMWGATSLLIQLASQSEEALGEIATYLNDLGNKLTLFEMYNRSIELDPDLLETFFDLLVDLVLDSVAAIKHFRKNDVSTAVTVVNWTSVHNKFTKTVKDIASKIDHLQRLVEAQNMVEMNQTQARLAQSLSQLNTRPSSMVERQVNTPCMTLPFQRNPAFFGRSDLLLEMQRKLSPSPTEPSIRSLALWGTGGIGKSQIALEYAHQAVQLGVVQVILWIASETDEEISKSFVDAANKLQPEGFSPQNTPDQNRYLVLDWLQKTDIPWLLIFDNVESNELLLQNWPITGRGSILVTCRSELMAASPAAMALEIPTFSPQDSSRLILKLLGKQHPDPEEVQVTLELAERLGGLALFLDIIAKQIRTRKRTLGLFLPYYDANSQNLLKRPKRGIADPYYSKDFETVWQTAFEDLHPLSADLIGLLCFTAPDGIPQQMISPLVNVGGTWPFLCQSEEFEDAKIELLDLSLIKINEASGLISIHRMTQAAYFDRMTIEKRCDTFEVAYRLLSQAFPRRVEHLFAKWQSCEQLIQHVLALQEGYERLRGNGFTVQDDQYIRLMADAAWYLSETGSFETAQKLVSRATDNHMEKDSLMYAHLCYSGGSLNHRRGRYPQALPYFTQAKKIRKARGVPGSNELANSYSGVVIGLVGNFRAKEALKYATKAFEVFQDKSKAELIQQGFNVDRYLRNRARAKYQLGFLENSKTDVEEAEHWQDKLHAPMSHYHGESAYDLGKIATLQGDFDRAEEQFQKAYACCSPGKPTHQSVMAARYHQGIVCMLRPGNEDRQRYDDDALRYFNECLTICQLNEGKRGDRGESARVKWRISQIMERQGLTYEAKVYRDTAEDTKSQLESTGLYPSVDDYDKSWDCFLSQIYR